MIDQAGAWRAPLAVPTAQSAQHLCQRAHRLLSRSSLAYVRTFRLGTQNHVLFPGDAPTGVPSPFGVWVPLRSYKSKPPSGILLSSHSHRCTELAASCDNQFITTMPTPVTRESIEEHLARAKKCSHEAAFAGAKAAAIATVASGIPTLASVRVLPWARANINPAVAGMAYFIAADKKVVALARQHSYENAPEDIKKTYQQQEEEDTGRPVFTVVLAYVARHACPRWPPSPAEIAVTASAPTCRDSSAASSLDGSTFSSDLPVALQLLHGGVHATAKSRILDSLLVDGPDRLARPPALTTRPRGRRLRLVRPCSFTLSPAGIMAQSPWITLAREKYRPTQNHAFVYPNPLYSSDFNRGAHHLVDAVERNPSNSLSVTNSRVEGWRRRAHLRPAARVGLTEL
ncbi:hypothetical protein HU200_015171 [Digitaria exilis]|uniref:Uncharacterized protein n=1 Tax=Digitaria exilis TaxID=1010633 RepID=A0A835FA43_9POAL|nr:hypothetical protein HU200_015171 [Digitaria exilis]